MSAYHRANLQLKQRHALDRARERPIRCPACDTQVTTADLLPHVRERCAGRAAPHPAARWLTWREARALGASKATLHRLASGGVVRVRGPLRKRLYLFRDLVLELARLAIARPVTAALSSETAAAPATSTPDQAIARHSASHALLEAASEPPHPPGVRVPLAQPPREGQELASIREVETSGQAVTVSAGGP
jgi:hypothetical protein